MDFLDKTHTMNTVTMSQTGKLGIMSSVFPIRSLSGLIRLNYFNSPSVFKIIVSFNPSSVFPHLTSDIQHLTSDIKLLPLL